jgi:hypothetical protein
MRGDPEVSAPELFTPRKIVSLWDVMQKIDGGRLFAAINGLCNLAHIGAGNNVQAFPSNFYSGMKDNIDFICRELQRLELPTTLSSAKNLAPNTSP